MALPTTLATIAIILGFLFLLDEPRGAYGSTPRVEAELVSAPNGLCASWVIKQGYKCLEYEVKTADGYILSMQRIPEGREGGGVKNRQPILLQHGVVVDGTTWVMNSPEESLAFILADAGFDVWISNTRGTRYSLKHATLDAEGQMYWEWSWDDLVAYEFPATVGFVYAQTGQKLHYVGHSQGTMVGLASFSQGNVDKLKSAALLSPIAHLNHIPTGILKLAANTVLDEVIRYIGGKFDIKGPLVRPLLQTMCPRPGANCYYDLIAATNGNNCCLNTSTVDLFLKNEPQPTSTKNLVHLAQNVRTGEFSKFDYRILNVERYGQPQPPVYNLSNIPKDFPLFLSYGGQDSLADPTDVGILLDDLKLHNKDKLTVQYVKEYAHLDFIMGFSAKDIVYKDLISFFIHQ